MTAPTPPRASPADEAQLGAADLWYAVRRGWWLLVLGVALAVAGAAAYLVRTPKTYEAVATLRIEPRGTRLTTLDADRSPPAENQVATEMEELRGRQLAEEVVRTLGLQLRVVGPPGARPALLDGVAVSATVSPGRVLLGSPAAGRVRAVDAETGREWGAARVGERLALAPGASAVVTPAGVSQLPAEVEVVPLDDALRDFQEAVRVGRPNADANIVTVRVEHTDPLAARDAANTLVARYLARRNAAQGTQARSAVAFLQRQLDTLTRQLAAAERDLQRFSEREGIADLETQANTGVTRLAELQAARNTLDAERRALQALVARSRAEARATDSPSPYRDLAGFPTLLRNQAVAELLRNLAELDNDRNALLLRRTPEDPDVITRTQRIVDVERQLRSTAETYLAGLTDQVRAIDAQLRASGQELARLPARQVELARLQRTPRALEEIFGVLQTRLKEAQVAQAVEDGSVRLIDPAVAPAKPVKPKSVLVLGLAVVFGAAAGFALALLRAAADRRLRRAAQLAEVTGLPVLVEVPRLAEPRAVGKRSSGREAFRRLRVTLLAARERADGTGTAGTAPGANGAASGARVDGDGAADGGHGSLTLLVTSPVRADGRTLVATHLAATFAAQGLRTLVVDADLRNGDLAAMLGLPHAAPGLVDIAGSASDGPPGDAALDEILYRVDVGDGARLAVLPAGAAAPSAPDLLGGARFQALLTRLRQRHDVIIFDSPSLAEAADADVLATLADGVLVVARLGHTRTDSLAEAVVRLQAVDARLLGAVVNDPERPTRVGGRRIGRARATRR